MDYRHFLKNHLAVIIPYSVILIFGIVLLLTFSKIDIHLAINRINSPFFDQYFKCMTEFGAFLLIAPIIIIMALFRYRYALMAIASSVLASLLVQILKRIFYADSPRPKVVFQDICDLHFVENVHLHSSHSFPSGHTAGAFALFIVLALINKRPVWQFLFLIMAVLVGYSRMYLSQHFLIDVVVGSVVGTASAFACYFWLDSYRFREKRFLDQSILTSLKSMRH